MLLSCISIGRQVTETLYLRAYLPKLTSLAHFNLMSKKLFYTHLIRKLISISVIQLEVILIWIELITNYNVMFQIRVTELTNQDISIISE